MLRHQKQPIDLPHKSVPVWETAHFCGSRNGRHHWSRGNYRQGCWQGPQQNDQLPLCSSWSCIGTSAGSHQWSELRVANEIGHTSYKIWPASLKQVILSWNKGISSSVELLNTCLRTSSVNSSSFCQKSEDVIGISEVKHLNKLQFQNQWASVN